VVDAAYHDIGLALVSEHKVARHLDAVCGGAGALVGLDTIKDKILLEAEGLAYGDGVAHAGLGSIGGDDDDIADLLHDLDEGEYAFGGDTVVVGDED